MGKSQRDKGARIEREMVNRHKEIGIHAVRQPDSGAFGTSHKKEELTGDLVIAKRFRAEVKARVNGEGFKTLEKWLGNHDMLFLRRDAAEPLVVLPWAVYRQLLIEAQIGR